MPANPDQVSVPLPPDLRAFVERKAAEEDRSIAAVIRRLIADAAKQERTTSAPDFGNPAMPTVTPATLDADKAQLTEWKAERKQLQARDCPGGQQHIYLTGSEAQRLNWLHTAVDYVEREIRRVEGMRPAIVNEHELAIQAGTAKLIHG
jgi:hypothetical protein